MRECSQTGYHGAWHLDGTQMMFIFSVTLQRPESKGSQEVAQQQV